MNTHAASTSKSDIRAKAVAFSARFADAHGEQRDRQTFWNEFFAIFKIDRRHVAAYELLAKRSSTGNRGWIDLLYPGEMAVEHKSRGENLEAAMTQLLDYMSSLKGPVHPWLLVVCDFQEFRWHNLTTDDSGRFALVDLADNIDMFSWIAGYDRPGARLENEEDVNLKATKLLADIHDHLKATDVGFGGHPLREWLTRILFCLFADSTRVWDRAAFRTYVTLHTSDDGTDLGQTLAYLFQILNTEKRPKKLDDEVAQFTYINGDLFSERLPIPTCDALIRDALLEACKFNWAAISPAIFGSMFQEVMEPLERRKLGAHYTTEKNILRTIQPLFLDDLAAELESANTKPLLRRFLDRLTKLRFFDPACGCGNFLVVAYREVRRLETGAVRLLRQLEERDSRGNAALRAAQLSVDVRLDFRVRVDQFYGIECEEFPAKIARTALYLVDHLENQAVSKEFGQHFVRFPIPAAPHISIGNALRLDWTQVLPVSQMNYVFGNPPYVGQKNRSKEQTEDLRCVWGDQFARWLDYVTAWHKKASEFVVDTELGEARAAGRVAFLSTNSITQGEQVARVWRPLLSRGMAIDFAHRTFKWTNEASGKAQVHCVIIGFSYGGQATQKRIFEYPDISGEPTERRVPMINPYLIARPNILVTAASTPIGYKMSPASYGNKPSDGSHLIVKDADLPRADPVAMKFIRRYIGTDELIDGKARWCIWLDEGSQVKASKSRFVKARVDAVRRFREKSTAADTRRLAARPYRFFRTPQPTSDYLAIPRHVSEARRWFTVARVPASVIASDALFTVPDPDGLLFGILSSAMFIAWLRTIGGAIKSDLRFSQLVYNSFPFPETSEKNLAAIRRAGAAVEAARVSHVGVTLGELYNPNFMPQDVIAAHRLLDKAVDRAFSPLKRFGSDSDRLELLFDRYAAIAPEQQSETSLEEEEP